MGPLSAVAISIWLIIYGLVYANVFAASPTPSAAKAVAILAIIAAVIVLIDTFWYRSSARWAARNPA
jgi:hypothetical protein